MHSAWDKYKMLDSLEIKRLAASMDYIAEKQDQRRKQDLKEAKVNAKGAKKTEDLLNKELNRLVPGRTPKSKSNCCTLQ